MGLDERLARLRALSGADPSVGVDVEAALLRTRQRRSRRLRRHRAIGAGVVAAVVVTVGLLAATALDDDPRDEVATQGADDTAPPPAEQPDPRSVQLWMSATRVPIGTAELAAALVNATDEESPTFGVGGQLERWDGDAWQLRGFVRLCVDHWLCRGDLVEPGSELAVEGIGIGVSPQGVSSPLWLPVDDLDVGAYRLVVDGTEPGADGSTVPTQVTGRFDVVDEPIEPLPPARFLDGPGLTASPPIVPPAGGDVRVDIAGVGSAEEMDALWGSMSAGPALERWTGESWDHVTDLDRVQPIDGEPITRRVTLPQLDEGAYRLTARTDDGPALEVRIWVHDLFETDEPPAGPATSTTVVSLTAEIPLVIAYPDRLELWDGSSVELIRVLTTAGEGRPTVAEGYRLGPVSLGPGAVWFTEYAGPEDQPSIWRLDVATGARTLVVDDADVPAISPDGTRLAYATGLEGPPQPGVAQVVEILSVESGATQVIVSYGTGNEVQAPATVRHLEWSPDGTRLLFADRYENAVVGVLDPASDRSLSDAVFLTDENVAPTWVDDGTIATGQYCCYADTVRSLEYVLSDARTGEVIGPAEGTDGTPLELAARPDGTLLYLKEVERDRPVGILAIPSERGAIEIEGVRSADW